MSKFEPEAKVKDLWSNYLRDPKVHSFPSEHILAGEQLVGFNEFVCFKTGVGMFDFLGKTTLGEYAKEFGERFVKMESERGLSESSSRGVKK